MKFQIIEVIKVINRISASTRKQKKKFMRQLDKNQNFKYDKAL